MFFRQKRVGLNGRVFDFFKFRSMIVNAEAKKAELLKMNKHANSITFKMCRDPRVTWVGPDHAEDEHRRIAAVVERADRGDDPGRPAAGGGRRGAAVHGPRAAAAGASLPGLTCIWQVSGRADLDFQQQVELDVRYIRERSLLMDLKLMLLTVPAVLSGKGAY